MSIVRLAAVSLTVFAFGLAACGKEDAPKPAAKPAASAPTAPSGAPAAAPAPQATTPVAPSPTAAAATPPAGAPDPDKALAKQVKSALEAMQGVSGQQIDVTAKGGAVTLWGTVADPAEQVKAVEAAKAVPGVKAVENKLAIVKGS